MLRVVVFGDPNDNVHHIRYAAAAFGAAVEFSIDFGGNDELPGIGLEQIEDNALDFGRRDHIALADEHCSGAGRSQRLGINAPHT